MKKLTALLLSALMLMLPVLGMAETAVPAAEQETEIATWFVVVMGMGIVFIGLVCLIVLISLMGAIMKRVNAKNEAAAAAMPVRSAAPAAAAAPAGIPNRGELVAAISVALAEELGKDVKAIRIHSIKRV